MAFRASPFLMSRSSGFSRIRVSIASPDLTSRCSIRARRRYSRRLASCWLKNIYSFQRMIVSALIEAAWAVSRLYIPAPMA